MLSTLALPGGAADLDDLPPRRRRLDRRTARVAQVKTRPPRGGRHRRRRCVAPSGMRRARRAMRIHVALGPPAGRDLRRGWDATPIDAIRHLSDVLAFASASLRPPLFQYALSAEAPLCALRHRLHERSTGPLPWQVARVAAVLGGQPARARRKCVISTSRTPAAPGAVSSFVR